MSILDGLAYVSIKLFGESEPPEGKKTIIGGIDKFPEDFERKMKFVDPSKILLEKQESERYKNQGDKESKSITSTDRDKLYGIVRYVFIKVVTLCIIDIDIRIGLTIKRYNKG